jgi:hypothetical protein
MIRIMMIIINRYLHYTLKIEAARFSETPATAYNTTVRHNPEDQCKLVASGFI